MSRIVYNPFINNFDYTYSPNSTGPVQSLTGNTGGSVAPDGSGTIFVVGNGTTLTSAGSGSTLTFSLIGPFSPTSYTAHGILVGEGASPIVAISPNAASGIPVISQGVSADPIYGTAVVAGGGTGAVTLTGVLTGNGTSAITGNAVNNHGVLLGGASNAVSSLGVAATGTVLSGNTGADPSFQALSGIAVTSITGTANQITASASVGAVTLSFPATAGLSVGSYQATTAPVGGLIAPGTVGIGTNAPSASAQLQVTSTKAYTISMTGTKTAVDGSLNQFCVNSTQAFLPTAGSSTSIAFSASNDFSAPSGQSITASGNYYAQPTFNAHVGSIGSHVGFYFDGGTAIVGGGTISQFYGALFLNPVATAGTCKMALCAQNAAIGYTTNTPPSNGIIVQGKSAFGSSTASTVAQIAVTGVTYTDGFSPGYTTTVTSTGNKILTVADTYQQYFTGSTTHTLTLPVVSTLLLGLEYRVVNLSSGIVTIVSSGGNTVLALPPSDHGLFTVVKITGTDQTSWDVQYFSNAAAVSSVSGTANQVSASPTTGAVVLTTPATFIAPGTIQATTTLSSGSAANASAQVTVTNTQPWGVFVTGTTTTNQSSIQAGLFVNQTFNPTGGNANSSGIYNSPFFAAPTGTTITRACGEYISNQYTGNIGTITDSFGVLIDVDANAAGTITRSRGLQVKKPTQGSTNYCATFDAGVGIGADNSVSTSNPAFVVSSVTAGNTTHSGTQTAQTGNNQTSVLVNSGFTPTGNLTGYAAAYAALPNFNSGSTNTMQQAICFYASPTAPSNANIISNMFGFYYDGGGTATNTVGNSYGIRVVAPAFGTTKFTAQFDAGVGIGQTNSTAATYALAVTGGMQVTTGFLNLPTSTTANGIIGINGVSYFHNGGVASSVYWGPNAGHGTTATGANNVVGGSGAGAALTSGANCVIIGAGAGAALTAPGNGQVVIGLNAGSIATTQPSNTFVGTSSGQYCSGQSNTFVGFGTGIGTVGTPASGNQNTCMGSAAGQVLSSGADNTFLGYLCGLSATSASSCVIIGSGAGQSISTTGSSGTTAVGYQALSALVAAGSTNGACTAVGYQALLLNTANTNTAVGAAALAASTTSAYNTAVGYNALGGALTSAGGNSLNIGLGYNAGAAYTTGDRLNICIGSSGTAGHSQEIVIGFTNNVPGTPQQTRCFIDGIYGANIGAGQPVLVTSLGGLYSVVSSARYKTDIQDLGDLSSPILKLRPRQFYYNNDKDQDHSLRYGLIAEEVAEVMPYLVHYKDDQPESVYYHELPVLILAEMQKLLARIELLEAQLTPK